MTNAKRWVLSALVAAMPALACFPIETENPGAVPLTPSEVGAVLACQETIKLQGQKFVREKLYQLEKCADRVLEVLIPLENELISQEQADMEIEDVKAECENDFEEVLDRSRKLYEAIVEDCGPVEEIILTSDASDRGDPLGFKALIEQNFNFFGVPLILGESVEELAASICLIKEFLVDLMISQQVPRVNDQHFAELLGFDDSEELAIYIAEATLVEGCLLGL